LAIYSIIWYGEWLIELSQFVDNLVNVLITVPLHLQAKTIVNGLCNQRLSLKIKTFS
jgi:hypothetical protein